MDASAAPEGTRYDRCRVRCGAACPDGENGGDEGREQQPHDFERRLLRDLLAAWEILNLGAAGGGLLGPRKASKMLRLRSGVRRSGPGPRGPQVDR